MKRNYDPALEPEQAFYQVTGELTGTSGDLIDNQLLEPGDPAGLTAARATYRVLYQSTSGRGDTRGEPIAVSGLIAFPREDPPPGGWPVLSWAHGTVGSNDLSAPSMDPYVPSDFGASGLGLLRNINRAPHALLNAFLNAGWAVAMTDYEGLGTYGNHPYLLGPSEGRGVLDIVPTVHQLAAATVAQPIAARYAIAGHSQGGQAALWAAHLATAGGYPTTGTLLGVAALAPASNLKEGLSAAYRVTVALPVLKIDLAGFLVLFCNGVFGGDPTIDKTKILQPAALAQYEKDFNSKSRAELSDVEFWKTRPPLASHRPFGIFHDQEGEDWDKYWRQVDAFTPNLEITVPIRISQARGDTRVQPGKTEELLGQLKDTNPTTVIDDEFYPAGKVPVPVPPGLGEHFGLLVYETEIAAIVGWCDRLNRRR